jgi:hypothetical protein
MTDDNDRETPIPDPEEDLPTSVPPPWERGTGDTEDRRRRMRDTQPMKPPTVEDVIEMFGHFQDGMFRQLDERDERILSAIREIGSTILGHYERETRRGDEHSRWIKTLRTRTHEHSHKLQEFELRFAEIEAHLGIKLPGETEVPPEPTEPEEADPA